MNRDTSADDSTPADTEQLRAESARIREELGDTVEALAAKADVKSRVRESTTEVRRKAVDAVHTARERVSGGEAGGSSTQGRDVAVALAAGVALSLVVALATRKRRLG